MVLILFYHNFILIFIHYIIIAVWLGKLNNYLLYLHYVPLIDALTITTLDKITYIFYKVILIK